MAEEDDDKFARYDKPVTGDEEIIYEEPNPLDAAKKAAEYVGGVGAGKMGEYGGAAKKGLKRIIILVVILAAAYFLLDYFFLSLKAFDIRVTDMEGKQVAANIDIYSGSEQKAFFSGKSLANYSVQMKPGTYRIEASAPDFKAFSDNAEAIAGKEIKITLEKNMKLSIDSFSFPQELYLGQQAEATVTISNKSEKTESAQLVFEQALGEFAKENSGNVRAEPETITIPGNGTVTATIKLSVPKTIKVKDSKLGDKKTAAVRIKYLGEKAEKDFTLYPAPVLSISPASINFNAKANGMDTAVRDITVENKGAFPVKDIVFSIDAEDSIKSWFSFQPSEKIDSLDAKGGNTVKGAVKLWIQVPVGTETQNLSPNIIVSTPAGQLPPVTMVLKVEAVSTDFIASASKETVNITKQSGKYVEIISESIRLQNKGVVDVENIDVTTEVACRDTWISFPQGTHVDMVRRNTTEEIRMRITAPASAEPNKSVPCQITVRYDDPVTGSKKDQIVKLFLVPKS